MSETPPGKDQCDGLSEDVIPPRTYLQISILPILIEFHSSIDPPALPTHR